jgi:uncharacterized protein DUF397
MTPLDAGLSRAAWRKSSYSASNGGQCVEVARNLPAVVAVRDSTDPDGARLVLTPAAWASFVDRVRREGRYRPSAPVPSHEPDRAP